MPVNNDVCIIIYCILAGKWHQHDLISKDLCKCYVLRGQQLTFDGLWQLPTQLPTQLPLGQEDVIDKIDPVDPLFLGFSKVKRHAEFGSQNGRHANIFYIFSHFLKQKISLRIGL